MMSWKMCIRDRNEDADVGRVHPAPAKKVVEITTGNITTGYASLAKAVEAANAVSYTHLLLYQLPAVKN